MMREDNTALILDTAVRLHSNLKLDGGPTHHIIASFGDEVERARQWFHSTIFNKIAASKEGHEEVEKIHAYRSEWSSQNQGPHLMTWKYYEYGGPLGEEGPSKLCNLIMQIAQEENWNDEEIKFLERCFETSNDNFDLLCIFDRRLGKRLKTIKNESHGNQPDYKDTLLLQPNADGKGPNDVEAVELIEILSKAGARMNVLSSIFERRGEDDPINKIDEFDKKLLNKFHYSREGTKARDMGNLLSGLIWGPDHYVRDPEIVKNATTLVEDHPVVKFWGWGGIGKSALAHKILKDFSEKIGIRDGEDNATPSGEFFEHYHGMSSKLNSTQGDVAHRGGGLVETDHTNTVFISMRDSESDALRGSARRIFKAIVKIFDPRANEYDDDELRQHALQYLRDERILFVLDNLEDLSDPKTESHTLTQGERENVDLIREEYGKVKSLIDELQDLGTRKVMSRIIITTRIHTEAEGLGRPFEVPRLDKTEASDLFQKVIENEIKNNSEQDISIRRKQQQMLQEARRNTSKIADAFREWDSEGDSQGAHPLIVISASHSYLLGKYEKPMKGLGLEYCLADWKKGNEEKQKILVYCCQKLIGTMNKYERKVVDNIVNNRNIITKQFFRFEDLERYDVFSENIYQKNFAIIEKFVGWNWVRKKMIGTHTYYHWLPEIIESIHTSLGIDRSEIFGTDWKVGLEESPRFAPTKPAMKKKIESDSKLLDRWSEWLESKPNISFNQGYVLPWKETQKHKDILYVVHTSSDKIETDSESIEDSHLNRIYQLSKRTIEMFIEEKDLNELATKLVKENFAGIWGLYSSSARALLSRIDEGTHDLLSARETLSMGLVEVIQLIHKSMNIRSSIFSSDDRISNAFFELLQFGASTYTQDGFISRDEERDNLTDWVETQARILKPIPQSVGDSLDERGGLYPLYRSWLRTYEQSKVMLSENPDILGRMKGYAFWISLRCHSSLKPYEDRIYSGADLWREQEYLLDGIRIASGISSLWVRSSQNRALRGEADGENLQWIWEGEELCLHASKGNYISSGSLVYVSLEKENHWAAYNTPNSKVSIRCEHGDFELPGIYLARVVSHDKTKIHCDVMFGDEGAIEEVPVNTLKQELSKMLANLEVKWGNTAYHTSKLVDEIKSEFPDTSPLMWINGDKNNDMVSAVVFYSQRTSSVIKQNGNHVGFNVTVWPRSTKPKYIESHSEGAHAVIYGGTGGSLAMPPNPSVLARMAENYEKIVSQVSDYAYFTYEELAEKLYRDVVNHVEEDSKSQHFKKPMPKLPGQINSMSKRLLEIRNARAITRVGSEAPLDWNLMPIDTDGFLSELKDSCISIQKHKKRKWGTENPDNFVEIIADYFREVSEEVEKFSR